ncbi:MAG: response regulator transcription factor [Bacteroidales bacterium]|nr:response regulator transcription factor [Bacteroidales bacterium]MBR5299743.1 response regulator transcription factor [Bacteroidales bacterium]
MNTKIRCIVVDDEPLAVEMLASYVRRTPSLELTGTFTDSVLALSEIGSSMPDLVFMDIQMPDLNGLELSKLLPSETKIVFTTAFKEYAFESYEVGAVDYLLKPIKYQKFIEAVAKAEKWFSMTSANPVSGDSENLDKDRKSAFIKVDGVLRNIEFDDILYVAGMKDYVTFHLQSDSIPLVTHITMKAIEDLLPDEKFMRIHRSYIVALDKISAIDSYGDVLIGKVSIPVSDSYRKDIDRYIKDNLLTR